MRLSLSPWVIGLFGCPPQWIVLYPFLYQIVLPLLIDSLWILNTHTLSVCGLQTLLMVSVDEKTFVILMSLNLSIISCNLYFFVLVSNYCFQSFLVLPSQTYPDLILCTVWDKNTTSFFLYGKPVIQASVIYYFIWSSMLQLINQFHMCMDLFLESWLCSTHLSLHQYQTVLIITGSYILLSGRKLPVPCFSTEAFWLFLDICISFKNFRISLSSTKESCTKSNWI